MSTTKTPTANPETSFEIPKNCKLVRVQDLQKGDVFQWQGGDMEEFNTVVKTDDEKVYWRPGGSHIDSNAPRIHGDIYVWLKNEKLDQVKSEYIKFRLNPSQSLLETLADIAYTAGAMKYYSGDSREDIQCFIVWAEAFEEMHENTDWDTAEMDYVESIYNYTYQVIKTRKGAGKIKTVSNTVGRAES